MTTTYRPRLSAHGLDDLHSWAAATAPRPYRVPVARRISMLAALDAVKPSALRAVLADAVAEPDGVTETQWDTIAEQALDVLGTTEAMDWAERNCAPLSDAILATHAAQVQRDVIARTSPLSQPWDRRGEPTEGTASGYPEWVEVVVWEHEYQRQAKAEAARKAVQGRDVTVEPASEPTAPAEPEPEPPAQETPPPAEWHNPDFVAPADNPWTALARSAEPVQEEGESDTKFRHRHTNWAVRQPRPPRVAPTTPPAPFDLAL